MGEDHLRRWNKLSPGAEYPPKGRRTLKVLTSVVPPPRVKVEFVVSGDLSWGDIAARFRVEGRDLRAWNWQMREPKPGAVLTLWVDPAFPYTINPGHGPRIDPPAIPPGGLSVGKPDRGKLVNGVALPNSPLYDRGHRRLLWGSSYTLTHLTQAIADFRHDSGWTGTLVVGAISRKHGRRLPPHISHQSGRDVDIRLPRLPGLPDGGRPNPDEIDWLATWELVDALVETEAVDLILLDASLHRRLYEAARIRGETRETLRPVIQWPSWTPKADPIVRVGPGHKSHIHVRFKCAPDERRCRSKR